MSLFFADEDPPFWALRYIGLSSASPIEKTPTNKRVKQQHSHKTRVIHPYGALAGLHTNASIDLAVSGKLFILWIPPLIPVAALSDVTSLDSKGRITLPKDVRKALEMNAGDRLTVRVLGNKVILERIDNPFEVLDRLLKNIKFDVRMRKSIEKLALEEAERRVRESPSRD